LLIYGAIVITNVDNLFRFILQKKIADVHPLVTVFGVIIGLNWFGLPGLVFGPILISYFLIMIRIYRLEYGNINILDSENNTLSTTEIENKNTQKK
jgi:predicted PurR-regulated permease PerM